MVVNQRNRLAAGDRRGQGESASMFVIAYDIADPARLRRVARLMERHALRVQKSVFLYRGTAQGMRQVLDAVSGELDPAEDIVQAWRLAAEERPMGEVRGTPLPHRPAAAVAEPGRLGLVDREES